MNDKFFNLPLEKQHWIAKNGNVYEYFIVEKNILSSDFTMMIFIRLENKTMNGQRHPGGWISFVHNNQKRL